MLCVSIGSGLKDWGWYQIEVLIKQPPSVYFRERSFLTWRRMINSLLYTAFLFQSFSIIKIRVFALMLHGSTFVQRPLCSPLSPPPCSYWIPDHDNNQSLFIESFLHQLKMPFQSLALFELARTSCTFFIAFDWWSTRFRPCFVWAIKLY